MEVIGKLCKYGIYYGVFYVVFLIVVFSFFGKRKEQAEGLCKEATGELKGIAILMVLLGHMSYMFGIISMPVTPALGAPAVDIFLFLSGFGLLSSYEQKGLKGFARKRLAVIFVPYLVMCLLKLPFMVLMKMNASDIFLNFMAFRVNGDTTMWYVQYILICYVVFYLIFSVPKLSKGGKVALLAAIGFAGAVVFGFFYYGQTMPYQFAITESYSHHLSFPLGAAFCLYYEKIKQWSVKAFAVIAAGAFVVFQFFTYPGIDGYIKYYIHNLSYVLFFAALFFILKHFGIRSKLLQKLGALSYYIYLNEYLVMSLIFIALPIPNELKSPLILFVSIGLAIPVRMFCRFMLQKINARKAAESI